MSFETEAELSLTVPRSELQNVQRQIEDGIGAVEVGATDGGSMSAQTTGASGGGGRGGRRVMRLAEERNEHLDDAVIYLESIEDTLSEGGLLGGDGGGFGGIITELAGAGAETAGDVAIEAGDQVAEAIQDTLVGTVSTALGTAVSDAVSNSEVAVADGSVPVTPNPLPVEGGGGGGTTVSPTVNTNPEFSPTFKPTVDVAPDIELPDLKFGGGPGTVRVDESQLPLSVVRDPLPVENIAPLAVEDVGPITVAVDVGGSGTTTTTPEDPSPTGGIQIGGESGITIGPGGIQAGGQDGLTLGRDPGDPTGTKSAGATRAGSGRSISVTYSPTNRVDVDPRRFDRLKQDIVDAIERNVERDIDSLEDELDELRSEFESFQRDFRS